jgi:hypothetical protein
MSDYDIHSCGYYCDRFACVLRQRDELRDKLFEEIRAFEGNTQTSDTKPAESSQSLWRKRQNNIAGVETNHKVTQSDINRSQGRIRVINEPIKKMTKEKQFFKWWNGDELVEGTGYEKGTPLYWAIQGWEAALREMNKEVEKNGEPL